MPMAALPGGGLLGAEDLSDASGRPGSYWMTSLVGYAVVS